MRRSMAVLAALTLALVLPATASAARSTRLTDHTVSIDCKDGIHPMGETGFAFFGARRPISTAPMRSSMPGTATSRSTGRTSTATSTSRLT